jgi:Leucine-rich repeat (LRR) protein
LTNKKLYKFLISSILIVSTISVNAQLLDSIAIDTVPTYSLQKALKQDPLKVYKLSLKKMKLTELPPEIYNFKNLQVLDVKKNKLKKFPKKIVQFKYLQELDISTNKIQIVTKELGELVHLKKFIASTNKIVSIPPEIKNLKKLTFLDLWGNDIGSLPYEISELKNTLQEIDMRVILMSNAEHKKIKGLLPNTKIRFSKSCDCGF